MTLDWVEGNSIRETEVLQSQNIDTNKIATDIIQHFLRHAVRDGFFHADMHQGNIFVDKNGQIIPIDFGIMGRLDKLNKRFLQKFYMDLFKETTKRLQRYILLLDWFQKMCL